MIEFITIWVPSAILSLMFGLLLRLVIQVAQTDSIKDKSYARQFVEWVSDLRNA